MPSSPCDRLDGRVASCAAVVFAPVSAVRQPFLTVARAWVSRALYRTARRSGLGIQPQEFSFSVAGARD